MKGGAVIFLKRHKHVLSVSLVLLGSLLQVPALCHAQELTFDFSVTVDGGPVRDYQFGLHTGALPGVDDDDVPEPPVIPGAGFESYFVLPAWAGGFPNRWNRDFRPEVSAYHNYVELWLFRLQSGGMSHVVTISVDTLGPVTVPYKLFFFGPGVNYEPIIAPHTFTFISDGNTQDFFWELRLSEVVTIAPAGWGEVKCEFR